VKKYQIDTFQDLMDEITWNWDSSHYKIIECVDLNGKTTGTYVLNKLYIHKKRVDYKEHTYTLNPKVYKQFLKFYRLFNEK